MTSSVEIQERSSYVLLAKMRGEGRYIYKSQSMCHFPNQSLAYSQLAIIAQRTDTFDFP